VDIAKEKNQAIRSQQVLTMLRVSSRAAVAVSYFPITDAAKGIFHNSLHTRFWALTALLLDLASKLEAPPMPTF
jgi:hypothetical protein